MDFNKKLFITIAIVGTTLIPILVSAQGQDYLYVFGSYDGSQYSLDSADQRVLQQVNAHINNSGTYELRLYRGNQLVSHNFLEISAPGQAEVIGSNNTYNTIQQKKTQFIVALPLTGSFDVIHARVQLLKNGQILIEKSLIDLHFQVLAVQANTIQTTENLATDSSYLFHLYYDNGQLFADRDVQFKYDIISETFVPETINTGFPYKGEVVNLKGEVVKTFQFDPRHGDPKFLKGKISVKAPYIPDGQKVNFYNAQGNQLLSIFVSESSFCNDDGVCNADVGEDAKTCPSDCKTATPVPTVSTGGPSSGGGGSGLVWGLIYIIAGVGLAGGLWYFFKKRKSSDSSIIETTLPPSPPST